MIAINNNSTMPVTSFPKLISDFNLSSDAKTKN